MEYMLVWLSRTTKKPPPSHGEIGDFVLHLQNTKQICCLYIENDTFEPINLLEFFFLSRCFFSLYHRWNVN